MNLTALYFIDWRNPNPNDMFFFEFHRNLASIQDREICCYSISCKEKENIGMWLFEQNDVWTHAEVILNDRQQKYEGLSF